MNVGDRRWRALRLFVLDRDGWRCRMLLGPDGLPLATQTDRDAGRECGELLTDHDHGAPTHGSVDHIVARTDGGGHEPSNLQAASRRCNSQRSAVVTNTERARQLNVSRQWW